MIIDTGPLVAALHAGDRYHAACVEMFATVARPLRMPGPVLTEVCYFIERDVGSQAEADFLTTIADGGFELIHLLPEDLRRMADLVRTYHDLPLGAVDACVVAVAERLDDFEIATLDRRHFSVVRPTGNRTFSLRP